MRRNDTELVFVGKKGEVYTTSEIIAQCATVQHHAVQQLISTYQKDFEEFGQVAFEMRAVKYSRGTNYEKIYHLNEQQATLLMTYLKNTEVVRAFKKEQRDVKFDAGVFDRNNITVALKLGFVPVW